MPDRVPTRRGSPIRCWPEKPGDRPGIATLLVHGAERAVTAVAGTALCLLLGAIGPGTHQGPDATCRTLPGLADLHVTAASGHVREVDLFIATPGGLFLVEIKSHPGTATSDGSTWLFRDGGKVRTIENSLHFTDQKAKELKSQLDKAARKLDIKVPRVEAVVFLSAETLKSRLDEFQRQRVYGRDQLEKGTGLPGIWTGFLNQPPRNERSRVTPTLSRKLPELLHEIGIARLHRIGRVGPYELGEKSFDSGPTWEDYLAANPSLPTDYPRAGPRLPHRADRIRRGPQVRAAGGPPGVPGPAGHLARRDRPSRGLQRRAPGGTAASWTCPRSGSSPTPARAPTATRTPCSSAEPAGTTRTRPPP